MAGLFFGSGIDKGFENDLKRMNSKLNEFKGSVQSMNQAFAGGMAVLGGWVTTAYSVYESLSSIINTRAKFEKFEAVLTNALGSKSEATKGMQMIIDFASKTPFQVDELTESYIKLVNRGFIPTMNQMTRLGDLASSTGKSLDQLVEALLDAQTGEFERLKEFGIVSKKSGDKVTFTFKGVATQVKATDEEIRKYILSLGELKGVSGSMAAISETLEGKISNLGDKWTQLLNTTGEESSNFFKVVIDGLGYLIDFADYAVKSGAALKYLGAVLGGPLYLAFDGINKLIEKTKNQLVDWGWIEAEAKEVSKTEEVIKAEKELQKAKYESSNFARNASAQTTLFFNQFKKQEQEKGFFEKNKKLTATEIAEVEKKKQEDILKAKEAAIKKEQELIAKMKIAYDDYYTTLQEQREGDKIETVATIGFSENVNEILAQYQTYVDKRKSLETKYQKEISLLRRKGYDEQADIASKALQNELTALDESVLNNSKAYQEWIDTTLPEITSKGAQVIKQELSKIELKLSDANLLDAEQILIFKEQIKLLQNELQKTGKTAEQSFADIIGSFEMVNEFVIGLTNSFSGLDDKTKNIINNVGDAVSGVLGLAKAIQGVKTAASTLDKVSGILMIISAAVKVITSLTQLANDAQAERAAVQIAELERIQYINLALVEQNRLYQEGNELFTEDKWGTALAGLQAYNKALQYQNDIIRQIGQTNASIQKKQTGGYTESEWKTSRGAGTKEAKQLYNINQQAQLYGTELESALAGVAIKTKDKSGVANFFGVADEFDSLLQKYPELINANGQLNTTILKGVLETERFAETDKARLENLVEMTDKAQEAYAQFAEYIASMFGSVGDEVAQAFQTMYESGTDAMTSLQGSFAEMIESFTRDALEFTFLQPYLTQLNETTKALGEQYAKGDISAEKLQEDIITTLGDFYQSLNTMQPQILQAYENADRLAAEAGFVDAFANTPTTQTEQVGISGRIQQAITEETGSELVGRVNALSMSNERIALLTQDCLDIALQKLVTLNKIKENTDYLPQIASNTKKTYEKLSNL